MKKLIIGISAVLVLALAVVLFVNAGSDKKETKKATTEVSAGCGKCSSSADSTKACCKESAKMTSSASCGTSCPMKHPAVTK